MLPSSSHTFEILVVLFAIGVAIVFGVGIFSRGRGAVSFRKKPLLSDWERNAFSTLEGQLQPGLRLCPQVRLADMLKVEAPDKRSFWRSQNSIASKSVDFVVIELATGQPVLVVELDDKTHDRNDRRLRDATVNSILGEAGIVIARFKPRQRIDISTYLTGSV